MLPLHVYFNPCPYNIFLCAIILLMWCFSVCVTCLLHCGNIDGKWNQVVWNHVKWSYHVLILILNIFCSLKNNMPKIKLPLLFHNKMNHYVAKIAIIVMSTLVFSYDFECIIKWQTNMMGWHIRAGDSYTSYEW